MSPILGFLSVLIGPLIGALVGVLLGFKINNEHRMELEEEKRLFFRNLLMHEAKKSIELMAGTVNLIPVDAWNSVINSGNVALFSDKAIDLSETYFQIQNYNYEAKRVRDAIEEMHLHPEITYGDRVSKLKEGFDNKTKPETLKRLRDLEGWLMPLRAESITTTAKLDAKLTVRGLDGKEK